METTHETSQMNRDEADKSSDGELLARFVQTRENSYFATIERRHRHLVQGVAYAILRNSDLAKDTAQEVFLRLFQKAEELLTEELNLAAWLRTVTKHVALKTLEKHRREDPLDDERGSNERVLPPDVDERLEASEVRRVLEELSPFQRVCLKLFYVMGMSYKEIAQETGHPETSVKSYIQNGRSQFQKIWERPGRSARV
ncbi:MAG: RNA polymerase sigma factor [Bryobacteraceae bacterium]